MRRLLISKTEVIRHCVDCYGYRRFETACCPRIQGPTSIIISYIAYSKREHTAIMEYYNLNCKCLQYRHTKKQNHSLTTSKQEPSNVKKKKVQVTWELWNTNIGYDRDSVLLKYDCMETDVSEQPAAPSSGSVQFKYFWHSLLQIWTHWDHRIL
jgi:hypothetical protein